MEREEGIVVFNNTHDAIKADNVCGFRKIDAGLIPVHPSISLGCGFSELVKVLDNENIDYKALYYSKKKGIKREVEMLYEEKE